jgi:radical SAM protein (TIGR01212 family)
MKRKFLASVLCHQYNRKKTTAQGGKAVYRALSQHYREKFGCKVYKLAIDAGFTCPNRDGTLSHGGCSFCSAAGGGDFAEKRCVSISDQLEKAKARVAFKNKNGKYIAYFQSFTNTYAPVAVLESLYRQAIEPEEILGLSIGTRPDCLPDDVVELLARINREKPVSVELGLQTVHDETAEGFNRGYKTEVYFDAVRRLKAAGIEVVTHIILGLPGETEEMMIKTTEAAVNAGTDGVKFHLLHVLRGTDLVKDYEAGNFSCLSLEAYGSLLKKCVDILPEHVVIHRITGDGAKRDLIAPLWSADKKRVLNYLHHILNEP